MLCTNDALITCSRSDCSLCCISVRLGKTGPKGRVRQDGGHEPYDITKEIIMVLDIITRKINHFQEDKGTGLNTDQCAVDHMLLFVG